MLNLPTVFKNQLYLMILSPWLLKNINKRPMCEFVILTVVSFAWWWFLVIFCRVLKRTYKRNKSSAKVSEKREHKNIMMKSTGMVTIGGQSREFLSLLLDYSSIRLCFSLSKAGALMEAKGEAKGMKEW